MRKKVKMKGQSDESTMRESSLYCTLTVGVILGLLRAGVHWNLLVGDVPPHSGDKVEGHI